ncbi:MAG: 50S ribosomal protein L24 [Patescibacteria group bacterium]|jgi:large subunit ribosomal protein L24
MNIKKGDNVKVAVGKDKGKSGKVIQVFPKLGKVVVEGVNVMVKYLKTRQQGQPGQKVEFAAPLAAANVMAICPKCAQPTRLGVKMLAQPDGKERKVRICRKCKEAIE